MFSIPHPEHRAARLFAKADTLQDKLYGLLSWEDPATQRELRQMSRLYAEAATISLCLHAFEMEQTKRARNACAC